MWGLVAELSKKFSIFGFYVLIFFLKLFNLHNVTMLHMLICFQHGRRCVFRRLFVWCFTLLRANWLPAKTGHMGVPKAMATTQAANDCDASSTEAPSSDKPPSTTLQGLPCAGEAAPADLPKLLDKTGNPAWNNWQWQMKNRIRSVAQLLKCFPTLNVQSCLEVANKLPLAITPYYASLIRKPDASDPVFAMCVPQIQELWNPEFLQDDPLEEDKDMPVPGLIHRYNDRALLIATTTCSTYCRHCTRKRVAGFRDSSISPSRLRQVVEYLSEHPEITDVIVSGGDPMIMATDVLERVLKAIRSVESVQIIRIGTRTPVVMPQRITDELVQMISKYHPVYVNTHFNHPNELTPESAAACAKLVNAGIPMGNQSVLLRGVNDDAQVIETLCRGLLKMRVRPYYLFQCDLVRGVEHFRTPLNRGIEIMEYLRGRLSGLAIPNFVIDVPGGGGKIPLLPNYIVSVSPTHTVLRNYEGMLVSYPEPRSSAIELDETRRIAGTSEQGVWGLSTGRAMTILPARSKRIERRRSAGVRLANRKADENVPAPCASGSFQ